MGICRFLLSRKEEVSLFDNGLRIESSLKILTNDKWLSRYVVCQRRCLAEPPLIGIFKNAKRRERGEHLDLFYLHNYIGYEYGFKFKHSNKTLAILIQSQTLVFSFDNVESLVFWKEWLKDVCGRSAMFFVRIYSAPKDNSTTRLCSKGARIHITRYALVIVQEVPPKQRFYLNLEDLSDVECVQNKFAFRAMSYAWNQPRTFIFTSEQVPELTAKLQCLLKAKQYFNHSNQVSRLSSLKNSSLGQTSTANHPMQQFFAPSPIFYANDNSEGHHSPIPLFTSLYANENDEAFRASYNSDENSPGPPPPKKKSFEEGHYAIPVDLGCEHEIVDSVEDLIDGPIRSRGGSNIINNGLVEDFHFIEGTPAQFLNQQLLASEPVTNSIFEIPPPGLVKPLIDLHILSSGSKIRRSLAQKLKRHLDGSYSKYDGDRSSNSYPKDLSDGSHKQRKPPSKKSITPTKELMTKLIVNPITEEEPLSAAQSPLPCRPSRLIRDESFDSSISSTARIDNAVLKGKERLKMSRRSSTSVSNRNSTANESEKSSINDSDAENCMDEVNIESFDPKIQEQNCVDDSTETRSTSQSISTAHTSGTRHTSVAEQNTYGNLCSESTSSTGLNQNNSLAISLEDLRDPDFKMRGFSVTSLKENSISNGRSSNMSERSLSICSELNSRIMFQRGGRNRASGKSNKVVEVPVPPQHPPPLPPRKISSQPCMPKPLQLLSKFDGDYADIDELMINERNAPSDEVLLHHSFNPIYSNGAGTMPVSNENIDYVQICPMATTALKELSTTRSNSFKRSNSLYDILSIHQPKDTTKIQNSEADYYASFDWTNVCMSPRALTSSASYLTHMLNKGNPQGKDSANSPGKKTNRK
uniref:Uncharacterized protein n=1 Tax=Meloidogyne enterolobii TaxID=390850 RepID=A0A6V7UC06_MELEN|nr:unnamed protein product [Meloidogyne enterolobii]